MSLTGSTNAEKIWNYLYSKIGNAYGVAGLMGNLYYESALKPKNLQNSYETKLGYTDDTYTAAVDDGSYSRASFKGDSAGYGLAQWTYSTRKANMYDYIITSLGKSIGDLESQLKFLYKELSESYTGVLSVLKSATDVTTASTKVLTGYEKPANQGSSVQAKRAAKGQEYYDKYASSSSSSSTSSSSSSSSSAAKLTLKNCPLYASSTSKTKSNTLTGTYYIWSSTAVSGRYRITNKASNVGVSGQITGWIDSSYVTGMTSSSSSSSPAAGDKLTLKKCPLYATATTSTKANTVTGTYYLWSAAKTGSRYMITNSKANVGKSGKITGWIDKSYVE